MNEKILFWTLRRYPAKAFFHVNVVALSLSGTMLSIFLMKMMSPLRLLRFSIRAPCPAGLK